MARRRLGVMTVVALAASVGVPGVSGIAGIRDALAQPLPALRPKAASVPVLGAVETLRVTPAAGFIDEVVAGDGERLVYATIAGGTKTELHVMALATREAQVLDVSAITRQPTALHLVGPRVLVIGRADDGQQLGALVELTARDHKPAGAAVYTLGPAAHITLITRDGKPAIAVHRVTPTKAGTRHHTELVALDTGKRIAAGRPLDLDASGNQPRLELRVNHWSDGWTRAHGIQAGAWDRKENARAPDTESTFDLVTGKVVRQPIADLFDQRRRFTMLAGAGGELAFVRATADHTALQLWHAGQPQPLALDQPFASYDPKSLQAIVHADGAGWLALQIDPVNAAAVARKRADPEYLDVFRIAAGKAVRVARVLATKRRYRFGVVGEQFWLLERNPGFERGGEALTLYRLP